MINGPEAHGGQGGQRARLPSLQAGSDPEYGIPRAPARLSRLSAYASVSGRGAPSRGRGGGLWRRYLARGRVSATSYFSRRLVVSAWKPECLLEGGDPALESPLVVLAGTFTATVAGLVPLDQVGKFLAEEWKEAGPGGGAQPEWMTGRPARAGRLGRFHELSQLGPAVGDPGDDRRDQHAGVDAGGRQPGQGPDAGVGGWAPGLETAQQLDIHGDDGDADRESMTTGQGGEYIEVAGDQRRLGGDAQVQSLVVQQGLQQLPGEPELSFRRLIGIGGRSDDQRGAAEFAGIECSQQNIGCAVLDQNVLLEGEMGRLAGRVGRIALQSPLVGASSITVGAAKLASDVRIERPERHVGAGRGVKHPAHLKREKPGSPLLPVQDRQLSGPRINGQPELRAVQPHRPHPHCRQETHPAVRASGPAHSGQTRILGLGKGASTLGGDISRPRLRYLFGNLPNFYRKSTAPAENVQSW